jgi:hypothetical protein
MKEQQQHTMAIELATTLKSPVASKRDNNISDQPTPTTATSDERGPSLAPVGFFR